MLTHTLKQIIYGVGFLVTILLAFFGISALIRTPALPDAPPPNPTPKVDPITVEEVTPIQHAPVGIGASRTVDLVARLRNPNPRAGVSDYRVTFVLKDQFGKEIGRESASTYLLPGTVQHILKLNVTVSQALGNVELLLPEDPSFTTIPASVSLPRFTSFLRERTIKSIGDITIEEQKGIVTNASNLDWQFVEIVGLALNANGDTVGVGQTFVGELKIGEQREITLQWPAPTSPTSRVLIFPTTNIYREENIIRAIGDPGLLR